MYANKSKPPYGSPRNGKVLVAVAVLLPALVGVVGLIIDGAALMIGARHAQAVADAAATSAATQLRLGNSSGTASAAADSCVKTYNNQSTATLTTNIPPTSGSYAGVSQYVQTKITQPVSMSFIHVLTGNRTVNVAAESVAGVEDSTAGAAIVVLDPSPAQFAIGSLPISLGLSLPSLIGGLEVIGIGKVTVHGAVLVNTKWGGIDENNLKVGVGPAPPYGVACTPLLSLTKLECSDLRVAGGVDKMSNYQNSVSGKSNPLHANRLAVSDPLKSLPPPTTANSSNVSATYYGGKTIISLPLVPLVTLNPGVYDYINVVSGKVVFNPGVYIIRGTHPLNLPALNLVAGQITANGVMFYLTNSSYSAASGMPDAGDGETQPASPGVGTLIPSAIVNVGLTGSSFSPLSSGSDPFNGIMFYQRRGDRRPLVIIQESLIGGGTLQGTVYSKWGHILLAGIGNYNARFVAGTMRIVPILDVDIQPTSLFAPARDVYLVQ